MTEQFQRGLLLAQQGRHREAAEALKLAVLENPADEAPHALLACVMVELQQFDDAEREAKEAVRCAPDQPYPHYALSRVLFARGRFADAEASIGESLRLNPNDADALGVLALIRLNRRDYAGAKLAAEQGLNEDPHHTGCSAARTQALTMLGDRTAALDETSAALARDPNDALAHAGRGWALLHAGKPHEALASFQQALRLDPTNAWSRQGMLEALKAKHWLYRQMLRWYLWMSRLPAGLQVGLVVAIFLLQQFVISIAKEDSPLRLPAQILVGVLVAFAILTWIATPLFNLVLMASRHGRMILEPDEKRAAATTGICLLAFVVSLALHFATSFAIDLVFVFTAGASIMLLLPLTVLFRVQGARRWGLAVIAVAMVGFTALACRHAVAADAAFVRVMTAAKAGGMPRGEPITIKVRGQPDRVIDPAVTPEGRRLLDEFEEAMGQFKSELAAARDASRYVTYLGLLTFMLSSGFAFVPQRH